MSLLDDILANKGREVEALRARPRERVTREPIDVHRALRRGSGEALRLIAEVKLRSPSAGALSRAMTPDERAAAYVEAGASMVSVLCDAPFFHGSWIHLAAARSRVATAPLLAKEFVVDPVQIEQARDRGADAVLLIARIVDAAALKALADTARREHVEPFVEVMDEAELEAALSAGARVVGVNARDLDSLKMDADRAARVVEAIPAGVLAIHLSGVKGADDVRRIAGTRADAALVGEALMREDDPRPRLRELVDAAGR